MTEVIERLEGRSLMSVTMIDGVGLDLSARGLLSVRGGDDALNLSVTCASASAALQQSMLNLDSRAGGTWAAGSTVYSVHGSDFVESRFPEHTPVENAERAYLQFATGLDPVIYVRADGLNVLVPQTALKRIVIQLGDGDDTVTVGKMNRPTIAISAGGGDDVIRTFAKKVCIDGQTGDDDIQVDNADAPTLLGGAGNDRLFARASTDALIDGGKGHDRANLIDGLRIESVAATDKRPRA